MLNVFSTRIQSPKHGQACGERMIGLIRDLEDAGASSIGSLKRRAG